jgi:hypothetical protein
MSMAEPLEEGTIVEIPYGMRIIRKGGYKKPRVVRKKRGEFEDPEEIEVIGDDEGDDEEVDYGEVEGDGEDEGGEAEGDGEDEDEESDDDEGEGGAEGEEVEAAPKYEVGWEFMMKKVPIYKTSTAEDIANRLGMPTKHEKLIPIKVKRRVYENVITYAGKLKMKVGPRGKLLPIESPNRGIKVVEDVPMDYNSSPLSYQPKKIIIPVNEYNPNFNLYDYVAFTPSSEDTEVEVDGPKEAHEVGGMIATTTKLGVGVKILRSDLTDVKVGDYYFVRYDDASLKKQKPPAPPITKVDITTPEDIFSLPDIPDQLRQMAIDTYIRIMNEIRIDLPSVKTTPNTPSEMINEEILRHEPISWNAYYAENFYRWIGAKYHSVFVEKVDQKNLAEWAERIYADDINPDILIQEVGEFNYDTTVDDLLESIKKSKSITLFQAVLIQDLEKEKYSGRSGMKGKDLAIVISNAIEKYYRLHPPSVDVHFKNLMTAAIEREHSSYDPTDLDRQEFESENMEILKKLHSDTIRLYNQEKTKMEFAKEQKLSKAKALASVEKEPSSSSIDPEVKKRKMRASEIGEIKEDNEYRVKKYEQIVYASHGSCVYDYLTNLMLPHIFMEGQLATFAKFFRGKLADGKIKFDALMGANIAHYLPELAMNKNLSDLDWMSSGAAIGIILHQDVVRMIDSYVNILHPTDKIYVNGYNEVTIRSNITIIEELLVDPLKICKDDSNTGTRNMVKEGKYVLSSFGEKIAENIPEGDMIICYDDGKFTCHSTRDVVTRIAKGDLINPHTQKSYPEKFIEKMKERYAMNPSEYQEPILPKFEKSVKVVKTPPKPSKPKPKLASSRKRHVPPKSLKPIQIKGMILYGDSLEFISLFATTFDIKLTDGPKRSIPITFNKKSTKSNVAVLSFDASDPDSIKNLKFMTKQIPRGVTHIYVVGLNSVAMAAKDQIIFKNRIKKIVPGVKNIFYSLTEDEDDMIDALIDIVIDMEGISVA